MYSVFLELVNRSINAGWLVLVIVLLRCLIKKAPKTFFIVLWAFVGIRLICPFSPESVLSLIPDADPIPTTVLHAEYTVPPDASPIPHVGDPTLAGSPNPSYIAEATPATLDEADRPSPLMYYLPVAVWMIVMLGLMLYAAISSFLLRRKISESIPLRDNVRLCDCIATPFLLGIFRPQIYLPFSLSEEDAKYAIAHERAHWKRHDHWWKLLGFLLLTVYWFHPLMWVAYILLCRDIELACDENVIRQLGAGSKKSYSNALINCSVPRRTVAFCTIAFGEIAVKERVRTVLHYKKPKLWLHAVAFLTCIVFALCFLTNPVSADALTPPPAEADGMAQTSPNNAPAAEPEQKPALEAPAEEKLANEPVHISVTDGYSDEEQEMVNAVLGKRIQTGYSSWSYDEYGNFCLGDDYCNYELPAELAEKYGTRDSCYLPSMMIYESIGELDATETLRYDFYRWGDHGEQIYVASKTFTVEIPAGGVAFLPIEVELPDSDYEGYCYRGYDTARGAIISASYGDLSIVFDD